MLKPFSIPAKKITFLGGEFESKKAIPKDGPF